MTIDVEKEIVFPLNKAVSLIPGRPHYGTIYRWATRGVRNGIRLETVTVGNIRMTSREAIQRFIAATTADANGAIKVEHSSRQHEQAVRKAERKLIAAGM